MEDKLTNKEEQLKNLADNFSLEIDTADLWKNVESQLPPVDKDRRRPIFWWTALGALFVLISFLVWNLNSASDLKNTDMHLPVVNLVDKQEGSLNENITNKHTENTSDIKNEKVPYTMQISTHSNGAEGQPFIQKNINQINLSIINDDRYDEKPTSQKEEVIDQSSDVEISSNSTLIGPSHSDSGLKSSTDVIEERSVLSLNYTQTIAPNLLSNESDIVLPFLEIKPVKKTKWLPYFALSSGMNLNQSNIYSDSGESLNLAQMKREKAMPGLSSAIRFGYENNSGFRISLGFTHNRLVSRFTQMETVVTTNEIIGTESSKIEDDGNVVSTAGIISETTITNYDLKWHRTHDFINAQLSVGKKIWESGKLSLFTDLNFSNNIYARHSGYFFLEDEIAIIKFESGEENPYTNAGLDVGLSMDLEYRINRLSISITPFASKGLNSILQQTNYYQIKNSQYGVQLGIVYRP